MDVAVPYFMNSEMQNTVHAPSLKYRWILQIVFVVTVLHGSINDNHVSIEYKRYYRFSLKT